MAKRRPAAKKKAAQKMMLRSEWAKEMLPRKPIEKIMRELNVKEFSDALFNDMETEVQVWDDDKLELVAPCDRDSNPTPTPDADAEMEEIRREVEAEEERQLAATDDATQAAVDAVVNSDSSG